MVSVYTAAQSEHSVLGMMSKNNSVVLNSTQHLFWVVQKSKNKVMFLPKVEIGLDNKQQFVDFFLSVLANGVPPYTKVSFGYLNQEMLDAFYETSLSHSGKKFPKSKTMKLTAVSSVFDNAIELFGTESLAGKQYIDLRETKNKFQSKIKSGMITQHTNPSKDIYLSSIKPLIEPFLKTWDENEGTKYGWQRHSGYDKSFFTEERFEKRMSVFQTTFLVDPVLKQLIGYSVISLQCLAGNKTFPYVIRKCNTKYSRNITKFLDYTSIKELYETTREPSFSIHWGASSGGVLKYKLSAFPKTDTEPSYFITLPGL